ncbi:TPA: DUF6615 family protein [Klebsiella pneumoniae]|uniref:DUF6615 family protein n=2 Tax=Klebsiella pneumoniae TaxID=573 RepID=UPI00210E9D4C|nr:DUF6615 family protein [Klebsiella pneumoniae]MCP5755116.1 hypothetical protein [Klebsiella pneumoniae]MCP6268105.1 hypothetical protein [Klebsiella pneumoniae]MDX4590113.1 DUF6615 family protein [Klebsiella pneumoniae]
MLINHLDIISDDVWKRLANGKKYNITQGEETLTDNILLYLASQNLSEIKIIQTPKNMESVKGTDWEWWIGNRMHGYLRYAAQAKKLDAKTNRYSSLNHKVGVGSKALFQHDILEQYAHVNQAIPLYAFYNHLDPCNYPTRWNCPLPFELTKLGCTVTSLQNVKYAIKNRGYRTFGAIHQFPDTVPLRCLAECLNIATISEKSKIAKVHCFCVEAKIYQDPWEWLSQMGHLNSCEQMPNEYYNHELGFYPKRILLINTNEKTTNIAD